MGVVVPEQTSVLVVEDNVDDIMILRRHFGRLDGNYVVDIVYTAAEAIARAETGRYQIAFVDHHLPDARGESLIVQMRDAQPDLPIVMLTGQGDERLAVKVMKAGAYDYLRKDDLSRAMLSRTLRSVLERARLEREVRAARQRVEQLAIRDGLTGLYNRRHFNGLLTTEFARAQRYEQSLACVMLDIDHFKQFNDARGHPCGDAVLEHLAEVLQGVARQVDAVARYGGEEFVLLLPNTDMDGAQRVAERIRDAMANGPITYHGAQLYVTVSLGVATSTLPGVTSTEALIKRADDALFRAKRGGRNRVSVAPAQPEPVEPDAHELFLQGATAAFARLIELHEDRVGGRTNHGARVALEVERFARALNYDARLVDGLMLAARLAGLGRLLVADRIWNAMPPLSDADAAEIQSAPDLAVDVLNRMSLLPSVTLTIRYQNEHWDGSGGPEGLVGEEIPEGARILKLIDAWCALTRPRPWREALSESAAMALIQAQAGTVYDPALVEVFSGLRMAHTEAV